MGRGLVFGDGTWLPTDGRIAYTRYGPGGTAEHFVQNADGTVSRLGRVSETGPSITPDSYRYSAESGQIVAFKDGKPVFAAPPGQFRGPDGTTHWVQNEDGSLSPAAKGGAPLVPGAEILEVQPRFPGWVLRRDPEFAAAITQLFVALRKTLGQGEPARATVSPTPYEVPGDAAGIDEYGSLKGTFSRLKGMYDGVSAQMVAAVGRSAALTMAARNKLASAILTFNARAAAAVEPDFASVAAAAYSALDDALQAITELLGRQQDPGTYRDTVYLPPAFVDPTATPGAGGSSYEKVMQFMWNEIRTNRDSEAVKRLFALNTSGKTGDGVRAFKEWFDLVHGPVNIAGAKIMDPGPWDHKPRIDKLMGMAGRNNYYLRLPWTKSGDEYDSVFYDIFSNVHYGYVGRMAGFSEETLVGGGNVPVPGVGANDLGDDISTRIGAQLFDRYGPGMTEQQFQTGVYAAIQQLQAAGTDKISHGTGGF
ncbi:polymorphic toxin type 44 domain-containing protein [Tsukamurella pseudospumae]|nr:polymorphic toxin type 44 domain-containing protein [Tsukamurella pseudospumae]